MSATDLSEWDPPNSITGKIKYIIATVGPLAVLMSASMGPGTIGSVSIAGSTLGYSVAWVIIASGWLAAAVFYASGKLCALTEETPFEVVRRYMGTVFGFLFMLAVVIPWYFAVMIQGNVLGATTGVLVPSLGSVVNYVTIGLVAVIAFVFSGAGGGFSRAKLILSALVTFLAALFLYNALYIGTFKGAIDYSALTAGFVPGRLQSQAGATAFSGIIGGSIASGPIWYAYLAQDNGWGKNDLRAMAWDNIVIYGILFSIFSLGVYISAAATLQGADITGAVSAAQAIKPTAGELASLVFTIGLWAAAFTSLGGLAATGAYVLGDLFNHLPFTDKQIELSIDDPAFRRITFVMIFVGAIGPFVGGLPPLPFIAYAMSLLTVAGPIAITIWGLGLLRSEDVGDRTGPWYLIVAMILAGIVGLFAIYNTLLSFFWISVVAILAITLRTVYHEYSSSEKLTPKPEMAANRSD